MLLATATRVYFRVAQKIQSNTFWKEGFRFLTNIKRFCCYGLRTPQFKTKKSDKNKWEELDDGSFDRERHFSGG